MVKKFLSLPGMYKLFGRMIGKNKTGFLFDHKPNIKVLDIGCGPGSKTHFFLDTDYTGIDISESYIKRAKELYNGHEHIKFYCMDAGRLLSELGQEGEYDLAVMIGLLHHLTDDEADSALSQAARLLKPGGEFRSIDGVYASNQSRIARWFLRMDRGA